MTQRTALENFDGGRARAAPDIAALLARAIRAFAKWREQRRAQAALKSLDAYGLRDIGVDLQRPDQTVEQIRLSRGVWF